MSVPEANVTLVVNGMQRYLELHVCKGEEKEKRRRREGEEKEKRRRREGEEKEKRRRREGEEKEKRRRMIQRPSRAREPVDHYKFCHRNTLIWPCAKSVIAHPSEYENRKYKSESFHHLF